MPLLITTTRPEDGEFLNPVNGQSEPYGQANVVSRRAVATLEDVPCGCGKPHLGGTEHADECPVGIAIVNPILRHAPITVSLPDGTTIEVEPVAWDALARLADVPLTAMAGGGCERIIAAYNAAQETGA